MKRGSLFRLGLRNIKAYPIKNSVLFLGLVILQTALIVVSSYIGMLKNHLKETQMAFSSVNRITVHAKSGVHEIENYLRSQQGVNGVQSFTSVMLIGDMPEEDEGRPLTYSDLLLQVDGKEYTTFSFNTAYEMSSDDFVLIYQYYKGTDIFTSNELQEYAYSTGSRDVLMHGRMPESFGEIVIPADLLRLYGVPEESWKDIIESEFELSVNNSLNSNIISGDSLKGTVTGILNDDTFTISSKRQAVIYAFVNDEAYASTVRIHTYLEDYEYADKIAEKVKKEFDLDASKNNFFVFCEYTGKQMKFMSSVILTAIFCVGIGFIIGLLCLISFSVEQKKYYLGMLQAIGYQTKNLLGLYAIEIGLVAAFASLISSLVGYRWADRFRISMIKVLEMEISWDDKSFLTACIFSLLITALTVFGALVYIRGKLHKDCSIEALREEG